MRTLRLLAVVVALAACGTSAGSDSQPTTAPSTAPAPPSLAPTTAPSTTSTPSSTVPEAPPTFSVVLVEADDVLNVRVDPNAGSDIVATLPFDATGILLTGDEQPTDGGLWRELVEPQGWVNSFYLTGERASDETILSAVADFAAALEASADLRPVVDDRGLFVISFDQPKRFAGLDLAVVMDDETLYSWGSPGCGVGECTTEATFADAVAGGFLGVYDDTDVVFSLNEPISAPNGRLPEAAIPDIFSNFGYVAIHDPGDDPAFDGIDWTTWYVFVDGSSNRVVGLALDQWAP